MKRFSLMLLAVGALAVLGTQAMADDGYGRRGARGNYDDLAYRGYHRGPEHRVARHYPKTSPYDYRAGHRSSAYRSWPVNPYRQSYKAPPRQGYCGYRPYKSFDHFARKFSPWFGY